VSRRELWALLFELAAEGMGIVVSTPYMDEAARCHRVGLIHRGQIVLEGAPAELLGVELESPQGHGRGKLPSHHRQGPAQLGQLGLGTQGGVGQRRGAGQHLAVRAVTHPGHVQ